MIYNVVTSYLNHDGEMVKDTFEWPTLHEALLCAERFQQAVINDEYVVWSVEVTVNNITVYYAQHDEIGNGTWGSVNRSVIASPQQEGFESCRTLDRMLVAFARFQESL